MLDAIKNAFESAKTSLTEGLTGENDTRCILRAASNKELKYVFGDDVDTNPMQILAQRKQLAFPYTPTVQVGGSNDYSEYSLSQTNYKYMAYDKSAPGPITVSADFTAQTMTEAKYVLAMMHFFRTANKSFFGSKEKESIVGSPPPLVKFSYLGKHMFKNVPVVIKDYGFTLQPDVDYIYVPFMKTQVPTFVNVTFTMEPNYSPKDLRDDWNRDDFINGKTFEGKKGYI